MSATLAGISKLQGFEAHCRDKLGARVRFMRSGLYGCPHLPILP